MQILPVPVHYEVHEDSIECVNGDATAVVVASSAESVVASYLRQQLARCCLSPPVHEAAAKLEITLGINEQKFASLDHLQNQREAYELVVRKASGGQGLIDVSAPTAQGLFWGVQSLLQILGWPDGITAGAVLRLRCIRVLDYPRFSWRGALLDCGRHWYAGNPRRPYGSYNSQPLAAFITIVVCRFSVAFIKKFIDLLALHKLNVFHWHLTEDQGWRIEIRSHPLLTRFGAYRGKGDSRCAAS